MKRKEFHQTIAPLTEKLYTLAYSLLPDDLQAEQLTVDSINAFLLKESKLIEGKQLGLENKKELQLFRKTVFKSIIGYMMGIGVRRSLQLTEQMKLTRPRDFSAFYSLEAVTRMVIRLRYDNQFSADEISDIFKIPRYEVIEKLHNGRFLLLNGKEGTP